MKAYFKKSPNKTDDIPKLYESDVRVITGINTSRIVVKSRDEIEENEKVPRIEVNITEDEKTEVILYLNKLPTINYPFVDIDKELMIGSSNPVANKAIYNKLNDLTNNLNKLEEDFYKIVIPKSIQIEPNGGQLGLKSTKQLQVLNKDTKEYIDNSNIIWQTSDKGLFEIDTNGLLKTHDNTGKGHVSASLKQLPVIFASSIFEVVDKYLIKEVIGSSSLGVGTYDLSKETYIPLFGGNLFLDNNGYNNRISDLSEDNPYYSGPKVADVSDNIFHHLSLSNTYDAYVSSPSQWDRNPAKGLDTIPLYTIKATPWILYKDSYYHRATIEYKGSSTSSQIDIDQENMQTVLDYYNKNNYHFPQAKEPSIFTKYTRQSLGNALWRVSGNKGNYGTITISPSPFYFEYQICNYNDESIIYKEGIVRPNRFGWVTCGENLGV